MYKWPLLSKATALMPSALPPLKNVEYASEPSGFNSVKKPVPPESEALEALPELQWCNALDVSGNPARDAVFPAA